MDKAILKPAGVVYLVDDNDAFRQSTKWLLHSHDFEVQTFTDASQFLDAYDCTNPTGRPECLLLDVRMPGMSGLQLQDQLISRGARVPLVFITAHADVSMAVEAMQKGALHFIEKPFLDEQIVRAISAALARDEDRMQQHNAARDVRARIDILSTRERQVLDLVVDGKLNKTIADILGISIKTVELHRGRVMEKMRAKSLAQLIQMAVRARDDAIGGLERSAFARTVTERATAV